MTEVGNKWEIQGKKEIHLIGIKYNVFQLEN